MSHEFGQSLTPLPASFEAKRHLNAERAPIDQARSNSTGQVWGVTEADTDSYLDEANAIRRHHTTFAQDLAQTRTPVANTPRKRIIVPQ
jgi:hypothetical protein